MSVRYAREKLFSAVDIMCASTDDLSSRLRGAWNHNLSHINPDDLPEHSRRKYNLLRDDFLRIADGENLDELNIREHIGNIVYMLTDVVEFYENLPPAERLKL